MDCFPLLCPVIVSHISMGYAKIAQKVRAKKDMSESDDQRPGNKPEHRFVIPCVVRTDECCLGFGRILLTSADVSAKGSTYYAIVSHRGMHLVFYQLK